MDNEKKDNVVMFPRLSARLLEKGMDSLKAKQFKEALTCFLQLLEQDPMHPQGNLGAVLSLIELGQLQDARERAEQMLNKDIGDYFDVLQIYLSVLIQLSEYEKVVSVVEAVLEEHQLPAAQAESFYQLLHFGRKMSEVDSAFDGSEAEEKDVTQEMATLENMLKSDEIHNQWIAIQQLSYIDVDLALPIYRQFLQRENGHPGIKTMVLNHLLFKGQNETFIVHKFGKDFTISIGDLYDVYEHAFNVAVKKELEERLSQQNPTLLEFALTVWWDYILAIYPQEPMPLDAYFWSHAVEAAAQQLSGMEQEIHSEASVDFHPEALQQAVQQLLDIERLTFGTQDFFNN
ncbi:hypothetical protein A374_11500 [Fictibacillus macauensis ZFHKF-1]|uniref:Cyclic nucleotide-binding domain-containing protein n=1 Tax=Fictibacillus macauensis ZFHKF-1 TaxID=1196324 RepID=I8J0T4_9BACL|nr:hypothetical protein [Fictibacillus macauensis]EIT85366.1 hypothetical protein A374_11500 [Fictibacillus macauensis ZFHKF-1]